MSVSTYVKLGYGISVLLEEKVLRALEAEQVHRGGPAAGDKIEDDIWLSWLDSNLFSNVSISVYHEEEVCAYKTYITMFARPSIRSIHVQESDAITPTALEVGTDFEWQSALEELRLITNAINLEGVEYKWIFSLAWS